MVLYIEKSIHKELVLTVIAIIICAHIITNNYWLDTIIWIYCILTSVSRKSYELCVYNTEEIILTTTCMYDSLHKHFSIGDGCFVITQIIIWIICNGELLWLVIKL